MQPQDPPPLDYRPPGHPPDPRPRRRFFLGLIAGSVASLIFWPIAWHSTSGPDALSPWLFLLAKFVAATIFLCIAGKRAIGVGLLVSFVIGFMIFFGVCAANFKI